MTPANAQARILELYEARCVADGHGLDEQLARSAARDPENILTPDDRIGRRAAAIRQHAAALAVDVASRSTSQWFALPLHWECLLGAPLRR